MKPQDYSTKPSAREPSLSAEKDHEPQLPEGCAGTPSTQGASTQAEAGSSGGESCPVTDDSTISWQDTLYFDIEPDDTEVGERSEMHERSRSHKESGGYVDSESSDGSDAYEEASEQATIETSKGKRRATADSTESVAGCSTKDIASSEPGSGRSPVSPANQIDSAKHQDPFLDVYEAPVDWNLATMVGEEGVGKRLNRVPAPSRSRLDSTRREMPYSPEGNSSTGAHQPWNESRLDPVHEHEPYVQSEEHPSSNSALSPPPLGEPYLRIVHRPMLPPIVQRTFGGYARQFGQPHSTDQPRVMRGSDLHEHQQEPTRNGVRSPCSPHHHPAMVIPRQCIPYKGLRTATDRWHEVVLPFHISRVDEAGRYQQLVVFDVDNFYLYAFALVDDISVLRGGNESEEDSDQITDETSATGEDVPDDVSADGEESLHHHERFQDALEEAQATVREEPELYDVCCSECHGRGWLKDHDTNDGGRRSSAHRR